MKFFNIVAASLIVKSYAGNMQYCNANSNLTFIIANGGDIPPGTDKLLAPNSCQTYTVRDTTSFSYQVCNLELPAAVTPYYICEDGVYLGDLYVRIMDYVVYTGFVSNTVYSTGFTSETCQTDNTGNCGGLDSYDIFINKTQYLPSCPSYESCPSHSHTLSFAVRVVIGVVCAITLCCAMAFISAFLSFLGNRRNTSSSSTSRKEKLLPAPQPEENSEWLPGLWRPRKDGGIDFKPMTSVI